jgi:tetratricopeptide (TPR) repeat protein
VFTEALREWTDGRPPAAAAALDRRIAGHPDDLLAIKIAHACRFMINDVAGMLRSLQTLRKRLGPTVPGYGYVLGCLCFALGESGDAEESESVGRRATDLADDDAWGVHGVAHSLSAQGRFQDGIAWLRRHRGLLETCNNFGGHLAWHEALLHMATSNHERALELLDRRIACYPAGDYRDVSNMTSLLFKLQEQRVPVGDRWRRSLDEARRRIGDHTSAFADLHYLVALERSGDPGEAARFLASMDDTARHGTGFDARVIREVAVPFGQALLAAAGDDQPDARERLQRCHRRLHRIGGSNAQRALFDWVVESGRVRGH